MGGSGRAPGRVSTVRGRVAALVQGWKAERAWVTPPAGDPRRREVQSLPPAAHAAVAPVAVDSYSMQGVGLLREVTTQHMGMSAADRRCRYSCPAGLDVRS